MTTYYVTICDSNTGEVTLVNLTPKCSQLLDQKLDEGMDFVDFYNTYLRDKVKIDIDTTSWMITESFTLNSITLDQDA